MSLVENIKEILRRTTTENGATAYNSTGEKLLDIFGMCGSLRNRSSIDIADMYVRALIEDKALATKLAFYTRDVRQGLGERRTARIMFKTLALKYPEIMRENIKYLPEYGRYDDLLCLLDTSLKEDVINFINNQLKDDINNMMKGKPISLLSKWLPSVNTSSYKTRLYARKLCKELNISEKEYRKTLSSLRAYINITEVRLSNKSYFEIRYDEVPSLAINKYNNAFIKHDEKRFKAYLESLNKNETKINASTLYPYNIVEKLLYKKCSNEEKEVLSKQWEALPNYIEGENNILVMADVSGSMHGRPLATSIGLALYFGTRNKGVFKNKFLTFSSSPELVEIKGNNIYENIDFISKTNWELNTNLESAFNLILNTAIKFNTRKEEMPSSIVIISDMEIDKCSDVNNWSFYDAMKERFNENGYEIPNIVFWNVDARNNTFHADANTKGVQLASGQSATVFKTIISNTQMTPYEYMLSVLNTPRYEQIYVQS